MSEKTAMLEIPRTFCRFVSERADDFAWENDKIAFRAYGPGLEGGGHGIDCWFKRVDYPMIDTWYREDAAGKSYHIDHGEGYDPYIVGATCGCGGLGLWVAGKIVAPKTFKDWKIVRSTPAESVFMLRYEWTHGGHVYEEEKRISIKLGDRLFGVISTLREDGELVEGLPVVVGLTTHDGKAVATGNVAKGWMACWEEIDGFGIGTGVVMAPECIEKFHCLETSDQADGHALFVAKTNALGRVMYHAGYGWEKAGEIKCSNDWNEYLENFLN